MYKFTLLFVVRSNPKFVQNLIVPANRGVGFFSVCPSSCLVSVLYVGLLYNQKCFCFVLCVVGFFFHFVGASFSRYFGLLNFQFTLCYNKPRNRMGGGGSGECLCVTYADPYAYIHEAFIRKRSDVDVSLFFLQNVLFVFMKKCRWYATKTIV